MRILFFIASLGAGGAERVTTLLANAWAGRSHEVALVTLAAAGSDFFPVSPSVRRIGLEVLADSDNPLEAVLNNVRRITKLRNTVAALRPDVVIGFCDKANILALLATRGLACKVIVSERTDPAQHAIGRFWARMRRLAYPWADAVVVQTESVRRWVNREMPAVRAVVIPNPVPAMARAITAERETGEKSEPVAVAMGRLSDEKGFDLLLAAFAAVADRHPRWRLKIMGEGERRGALEALAGQLGLSQRVMFTGRVANPEDHLRQADLFVLSSRYEGFPNALLEAMAHGLPAVSFDCPSGPAAIIRDGLDGRLVPAEDVAALAAALDGLMADAAQRQYLGNHARAVSERFGVDSVLAQWERLMAEVTA